MSRGFLLAAMVLLSTQAVAERRVAVLIGNSAYGARALDLGSPKEDVRALGRVLEEDLGFSHLIVAENVDRRGMIKTLRNGAKAAKGGTIVVFYSGHGVQVQGESYLVPVGADLRSLDDVAIEALSVRQVVGMFRDAKLRVVLLDACRAAPFAAGAKSIGQAGLARDKLDGLGGTIVSYAARPGTVAYDGGPGKPSPYTQAMIRALGEPGLDLPNVFMAVRGELAAMTRSGAHGPQQSEEVSTLTRADQFFFRASGSTPGKAKRLSTTTSPPPVERPPVVNADAGLGRVAVLDLAPASLDDKKLAALLTSALTEAIAKTGGAGRVLGMRELRATLEVKAAQALAGCSASDCVLNAKEMLDVDHVVTGQIGRMNGQVLVFLSLVGLGDGRVVARASHGFRASVSGRKKNLKALSSGMRAATNALLLPEAAAQGDDVLQDLRIAMVFEEEGPKGTLKVKRVATCVEETLQEADVDVVDPEQVAAMKGKDREALFKGRLPDHVTSDEADVLLVGKVAYEPMSGWEEAGVKNVAGDLSLRLIKVDTGRVVVSKQLAERGNGFRQPNALNSAAKKLCKKARPVVEEGLKKRAAKGNKVTVQVEGGDPRRVTRQLKKQALVTRARLRKFSGKSAVIDVVVAAGDGVALALALRQAGSPLEVQSAGPGVIEVRAR